MTQTMNALGQPIGASLADWAPPPLPSTKTMTGRFCRLEALAPERHARELYAADAGDRDGRDWTYLSYGPFQSLEGYRAWLESASQTGDPLFWAIIRAVDGKAVGVASYVRITPANGSMEVGHVHFSEWLKHTPAATEAMFLMMRHAFDLGYRRYEWKCDALNAASRAAAQRLGFTHEGIFRNAMVYNGRSRDTAWYSVIVSEWPALSQAFNRWLAPDNFDAFDQQRVRLSDLTGAIARPLL